MSGAKARRVVAVRIAGHEYKIRSEADEDGLIRIAGYVDRAMHRVRERTGTVDTLDVAVLTCLNLARELLAMHEERVAGAGDDRLRSLIERVESILGERGPRTGLPDGAAAVGEDGASEARPRTLDLPSVEDLRDHRAASSTVESAQRSAEGDQRSRAASGGRDRLA